MPLVVDAYCCAALPFPCACFGAWPVATADGHLINIFTVYVTLASKYIPAAIETGLIFRVCAAEAVQTGPEKPHDDLVTADLRTVV